MTGNVSGSENDDRFESGDSTPKSDDTYDGHVSRASVEALITGRLKLNETKKSNLVEKLTCVINGPLNSQAACEALVEIMEGDFLAVAGNPVDFFKKVFGWEAADGSRVMELYRAGRWAEVSVPRGMENHESTASAAVDPQESGESRASQEPKETTGKNKVAAEHSTHGQKHLESKILPNGAGTHGHSTNQAKPAGNGKTSLACKGPATKKLDKKTDSTPTKVESGASTRTPPPTKDGTFKHNSSASGKPKAPNKTARNTGPGPMVTLEVLDPGGKHPIDPLNEPFKDKPLRNSERTPLNAQEVATLQNCKHAIKNGFKTFVEVGWAFSVIMRQRLYRETHRRFAEFCEEVIGMSYRRAYQLRDAAEFVERLKRLNNCSKNGANASKLPLPENESQVRSLAGLRAEEQLEVWKEVHEKMPDGNITGKVLESILRTRKNATGKTHGQEQGEEAAAFDSATELKKTIEWLSRNRDKWPIESRHVLTKGISEWLRPSSEASA